MLAEYTTTFEDFKAAQRLAVRRTMRNRIVFLVFHRVLPLLGAVAVILLIWDMGFRGFLFPSWVGGWLFLMVWLGFALPAVRWWQFRRLYRAMKNGRPEGAPIQFELTETEFISRVPGRSEGHFRPAAIFDYRENEEVALVYVTKNQFIVLPKRALDASQWQALREWMEKRHEGVA